jgi:hypothetical protein
VNIQEKRLYYCSIIKYKLSNFVEVFIAWCNLFILIIMRPPKPEKFKPKSSVPYRNALAREDHLNEFAHKHTSQFVSVLSLVISVISIIISLT